MKTARKTYSSKILELLEAEGPQKWGDIKKHLGDVYPEPISYALKKLDAADLIEKDLTTRKYAITEAGRFVLHNEHLGRLVIDGRSPAYKKMDWRFWSTELQLMSYLEVEQLNKMPLDICLLGDADLDYQKVLEKIQRELFSFFPQMLMREFAEEVAWQRGLKEPPLLDLAQMGLPRIDRLLWVKEAYNYEITLLLHFNPRELINSMPWTEILKNAKQDKSGILERMKKRIEELRADKDKVLEDYANSEFKSWILKTDFAKQSTIDVFASSETELVDKMVESIMKDPIVKGLSNKQEVKAAVNRKLSEYKIVPKTVFLVEKITPNNASS
jgi:DNA-binding Lrp family transcriptional regulator